MIQKLKIKNIVLVDECTIEFVDGLNILTGETGSGKSAILFAIKLLQGARFDSQLIGKFSEVAIVEGHLSFAPLPKDLFPHEKEAPLLVRREIHKSGKSRAFINDQQVSLTTLRNLVGPLIEMVDQSSAQKLFSNETQRVLLDLFGETHKEHKLFILSYLKQKETQKKIDSLLEKKPHSDRDIGWAEKDLQLIEEANWTLDEESSLTAEHHLLTHTQDLLEKIEKIEASLSEQTLKQSLYSLESAVKMDPSLNESAKSLKGALCEIEEVQSTLLSYKAKLELQPQSIQTIEDKLAQFEQIKRRFGSSFEAVAEKKRELKSQIDSLKNLEEELFALEKELSLQLVVNRELAFSLSQKRRVAADLLSDEVTRELEELNLPFAKFVVEAKETSMNEDGIDEIKFLFSANLGHDPLPIEKCASGGELSRLLLALKSQIADKENSQCIVFDEIDSNVGGHSATILGEKLRGISQKRQVITVTHFVQVAKHASSHFLVEKGESDGQISSSIARLLDSEKEAEYQRMLGNSCDH